MVFSLLPTVVLAEGGDSTAPTIITMQYDDYADYGSDVTVAPDDTVLEVVDGKLHAKGIGSATFTAGGTEYSVTVEKAKLNIVWWPDSPMRPVFTGALMYLQSPRTRAIPIGGMALG